MDTFLSQPTSHFHAPQPDRIPAIELKYEVKARVVMTDKSTSSILHSVLHTYPLSAAEELPKNKALMLMIRRQRTVETVDVDGKNTGKHIVMKISSCTKTNLIIFTVNTNLSIPKQGKHWFADGTFKANYQSNICLFFF